MSVEYLAEWLVSWSVANRYNNALRLTAHIGSHSTIQRRPYFSYTWPSLRLEAHLTYM